MHTPLPIFTILGLVMTLTFDLLTSIQIHITLTKIYLFYARDGDAMKMHFWKMSSVILTSENITFET